MTALHPVEGSKPTEGAESYTELVKRVQDEHPEYAEMLALARKAAELKKMTDTLDAQQVRAPIVTYSGMF